MNINKKNLPIILPILGLASIGICLWLLLGVLPTRRVLAKHVVQRATRESIEIWHGAGVLDRDAATALEAHLNGILREKAGLSDRDYQEALQGWISGELAIARQQIAEEDRRLEELLAHQSSEDLLEAARKRKRAHERVVALCEEAQAKLERYTKT